MGDIRGTDSLLWNNNLVENSYFVLIHNLCFCGFYTVNFVLTPSLILQDNIWENPKLPFHKQHLPTLPGSQQPLALFFQWLWFEPFAMKISPQFHFCLGENMGTRRCHESFWRQERSKSPTQLWGPWTTLRTCMTSQLLGYNACQSQPRQWTRSREDARIRQGEGWVRHPDEKTLQIWLTRQQKSSLLDRFWKHLWLSQEIQITSFCPGHTSLARLGLQVKNNKSEKIHWLCQIPEIWDPHRGNYCNLL